jgi:hypothetical protein
VGDDGEDPPGSRSEENVDASSCCGGCRLGREARPAHARASALASWASTEITTRPADGFGQPGSREGRGAGRAALLPRPSAIFPFHLKAFLFISTISYLLHGFLYVYTYVPCMYTPLGVVH